MSRNLAMVHVALNSDNQYEKNDFKHRQSTFKPKLNSKRDSSTIKLLNSKVPLLDLKIPSSIETETSPRSDAISPSNLLMYPFSLTSSTYTLGSGTAFSRNLANVNLNPRLSQYQRLSIFNRPSIAIQAENNSTRMQFTDIKTSFNNGFATERAKRSGERLETYSGSAVSGIQTARNSVSKIRTPLLTACPSPLDSSFKLMTDRAEESVYEKYPKIIERGNKVYKEKVGVLNLAANRKIAFVRNRREFLKSESNFMTKVPLLKLRQQSQIVDLKIEDEQFFPKVTKIFTEGTKELDLECLTVTGERGIITFSLLFKL